MTPAPFHAEIADAPEGARAWWLTASDGVRLRAVTWAGGRRGTAVIFPGRTEFAEKYGRVAGRLVGRGFAVAVIDWRGQGLSDRHPGNPMLGHVEDFRDYQRDVAALRDLVLKLAMPEPVWLFAHSMGGCIGLRTLLERADFRGAVFSAPMWRLHMKAATRELTARMTRIAYLAGLGARLTPGARPEPTAVAMGYPGNPLTSDPEVFAWCLAQITAHPELALGGPSMQWTSAALQEMTRLAIAPLPTLPVLVLLGGVETVVSGAMIRRQLAGMPAGELAELPGARHEIFMERPEIVAEVWRRIDGFLDGLPARRGAAAVSR
ncbi:MAG TPA: alpha/beta hydrolase [Amaricoccus sp.]|nr:alpha/beta hydrolase [Amaricoccus sp.]